MSIRIRKFNAGDETSVSEVVKTTLIKSNSKDYDDKFIQENIEAHSAEVILERSETSHMYVACDGEKIIGCGAIAPFWGSMNESILLTVFVLPEYQGFGTGRSIIQRLESDEFFKRADRVEIPASITACNFYRRCGYTYKNGITQPDEEGCIRLEKKFKLN